jgi:hypothetical protein
MQKVYAILFQKIGKLNNDVFIFKYILKGIRGGVIGID